MKSLSGTLEIIPVRITEHLLFNLLHFRFFKNSEKRGFLFFGKNWVIALLIVIPYILVLEVVLLRRKRFFVKFKKRIIAIVAFLETSKSLYIESLAVAPQCRRLGMGTCIIAYANKLAIRLRKKCLELSVLKTNIPALKLYEKLGFVRSKEKKWEFVLTRQLGIQ
jgi:ribosomal protein S18 acetylase RimI-like enzyme